MILISHLIFSQLFDSRVSPQIRRNVYMTGMREGDSSDFEYLLNRFRQSNFANDQLEMLRGLGASKDSQLLTRYDKIV